MGAERAASVERRPVAAVRAVARAVDTGHVAPVGRRPSGDAGALLRSVAPGPLVVAHGVQRLAISSPSDAAEVEAASIGRVVARMPDSAVAGPRASAGTAIMRAPAAGATNDDGSPGGAVAGRIQSAGAGGRPLPATVRKFMEPRFNADFGAVRIHTGTAAAALSADLAAHAFTIGRDVFFAAGRFRPDTAEGRELIAHELTHVLQQGAVDRAGSFVRPSATEPGTVQRDAAAAPTWFDSLVAAGSDALDFGETAGWKLVDQFAPGLSEVMKNGPAGVTDWLKGKAESAAQAAFDIVSAPVKAVGGAAEQLTARFAPLTASVQQAASQIAANDCSPLRQAAEKIEATATAIVEPIVEWLQPVVAKVKSFLDTAWNLIGAPIWEWIKQYAADRWNEVMWLWGKVKAVAGWIWEKTKTYRELMGKAWTWLKNKLGIGDGAEGENGLLQWVQGKVEAAWAVIKVKLEPYRQQITTIAITLGAALIMVSPAGPIVAIGAAVVGAVQGLRWISANWGKGNAIVQARLYLEKTLIPTLTAAAGKVMAAVSRAASALAGALTSIAGGIGRAAAAIESSILKAAAGVVQWLAGQAAALAAWATGGVGAIDAAMTSAITRLKVFLNRVLAFLAKVGRAVADVWQIPLMIAGEVWNAIPACIRDPVVDFLGPLILGQIELFKELVKDDAAWQKTKADVKRIIKLVFTDGDMMGALRATFDLILRVFNITPDLLVQIKTKAIAAWDTVSKAPIAFIKNLVRSIGVGFRRLGQNILTHLRYGVEGWLAGDLAEKSITLPKDWTDPKQLFDLALDVLGISTDHIFELLAKRFDPGKIEKLKVWYGRAKSAVEWIAQSIDVNKSPAENTKGIIQQAKGFAGTIFTGIAQWIAGQVAKEIALMATAAAASAGLSEVLDVARRVYKAIVTAVKYARRILDMVNQTLDNVLAIAGGQVEAVGVKFEAILHKGMPVVIGFLANQVGLGGVGAALKNIVDALREKVDAGILWLIDKIKGALDAIISGVKAGVAALLEWWNKKVPFGDGPNKHTLQFDGTETSAELMVHSDPVLVKAFVFSFAQGENPPTEVAPAQVLIATIDDKRKKYTSAKVNHDDSTANAVATEILAAMDQLAALLTKMIGSSADGSEAHPFPIDYPKRSPITYRDVFIGPRVEPGVKIDQAWLASLFSEGDETVRRKTLLQKNPALQGPLLDGWKQPVRRLTPTQPGQATDGGSLGLADQFASLSPGRVVVYAKKFDSEGGVLINKVLERYGFNATDEKRDGDHVLERQLGGPNSLENLWPLQMNENRRSGSKIKNIKIAVPGSPKPIPIHEAREDLGTLHLLIKSVKVATD